MVTIRDCTVEDLPASLDIYNALTETTTIAWSELRVSLESRAAWLADQQGREFPVLVAVDDGAVVGIASYGDFRGYPHWEGYRFTVEHSIHVRDDRRGAGIGRMLLEALIDRARAADVHVMVGAIDGDNKDSIRFHARLDFVEVARMPEVGFKFGRWLDLVLMQKIL